MAKTTYKLLDFNYADASSGALCVMIKKKEVYPENISNEEVVTRQLEENPDFKGAGVCRVSGGVCLFTVDSITYQFNKEGNPASSNAFGWVLKKAEILSTVTAQGSVATGNVKTVTLITRDALSGTVTEEVQYVAADNNNKMMVDKLTPRDEFAVHAMRAIMGHIADPSILSNNEVNHYCDAAYQWAANMMQAAANARDHKEYSSDDSGENVIDVLDTNTEKLLDNIDKALRKTDAEVGESSTSVPAHWSKEGYPDVTGDHTDEVVANLPIPEGGQQYTSVAEAKADGWTWTAASVVITPIYAERVTNDTYEKFMEYVSTDPGDTKTHYSFGDLLEAIRQGGGGGGSAVSITPILTTGTAIATFSINTTSGTLYAPASLPLSGGTLTGDLSFNKELTQTNPSVGIDFNIDNSISITKFGNDTVLRVVGEDKVVLGVGSTNVAESESVNGNLYLKVPGLIHGGIPNDVEGVPIDKDDYVVLGGGGYKPLSEIGSGIVLYAPIDDINAAQLTYPQATGKYILQYDTDWGWSYAVDGIGGFAVPSGTPNNNVVPVFNSNTSKWEYRAWSSGGGGYTPGDGIDITNDEISVKYDDTTIKKNNSGELYAVGGGGITEAEMWTALGTNTIDKIIDSSHLPTPTLPNNLVTTDTSQTISGSKTFTGSETFTGSGVRITYDTQTILPISSISETRKNIGTTEQSEYEYSLTVNGGSNLNLSVNSTNVLTSKSTGIETIKVQEGDEMPFKKECITYDSMREFLDKLGATLGKSISARYDSDVKKYVYAIPMPYSSGDTGYFYMSGTISLAGGTVIIGGEQKVYAPTTIENPIINIYLNNGIYYVGLQSEVTSNKCLIYDEKNGVGVSSDVELDTHSLYIDQLKDAIRGVPSLSSYDYTAGVTPNSSLSGIDVIGYVIVPNPNS